jgi:hypothetical protein
VEDMLQMAFGDKRGLNNLVHLAKGQAPHIPWEREIDVALKAGERKFEHKVSKLVRADFLTVTCAAPGAMVNVTFPDHPASVQGELVETGFLAGERWDGYLPLATMLPGQRIVLVVRQQVQARFACILQGVQYQ